MRCNEWSSSSAVSRVIWGKLITVTPWQRYFSGRSHMSQTMLYVCSRGARKCVDVQREDGCRPSGDTAWRLHAPRPGSVNCRSLIDSKLNSPLCLRRGLLISWRKEQPIPAAIYSYSSALSIVWKFLGLSKIEYCLQQISSDLTVGSLNLLSMVWCFIWMKLYIFFIPTISLFYTVKNIKL